MNTEHRNLYLGVIAVLVILLIAALIGWDSSKDNAVAYEKARQLNQLYEQAGLPTTGTKEVARVLGDDAAVVCEPIGNGVDLGTLKTRLGVGGEFYFRPTDVDDSMLKGLFFIVTVYCPDELPDLKDFLDGFDFKPDLLDLGTNG